MKNLKGKIMFEKLLEVQWGTFTPVHIATLLLSVGMIAGLYLLLRNKSEKTKQTVLFALSLTGPAAVIYNILVWGLQSSVLEYLPLHLCAVSALLIPFLTWKRSNFLGNLLPVYSIGALAALVFNTAQAEYKIFDQVFAVYYFHHTIELGLPMLMVALGLVKIKPKYILPCVAVTFVLYTMIHFINVFLNDFTQAHQILNSAGEVVKVNYMYSLHHEWNPALMFLWNFLPNGHQSYFYMLLALPVIAVAYSLMNLKSIRLWIKSRKEKTALA